MTLTVEIPDNAKGVKFTVLFDRERYRCDRYRPGYWNGINGGTHYCQYFDMEDVNRVQEMTEVASALTEYGIDYVLSKLKRQYRIAIKAKDYRRMDETLKRRILHINYSHCDCDE